MKLDTATSNHNFRSFLWHAVFLALAQNFMDVDTVYSSMIIDSGGGPVHIGLMTVIMLGGSSFTQLFFAPYLSNFQYKKKFLLTGILLRVAAVVALAFVLLFLTGASDTLTLFLVFFFLVMFALAGAFANISYTDIFGKSILEHRRKSFLSANLTLAGALGLASALLAKRVLTGSAYPGNFATMFLIGGGLLFIASFGFWSIREVQPSAMRISGFRNFISILRSELRTNPKLKYMLGFINTQGVMISFLPFVVLYAKQTFDTQNTDAGFFLLFKVIGVVSVSVFVLLMARRIKYRPLLLLNALLSISMIVFTMLMSSPLQLRYIFILGGVIYALYSITMNGVLLEISGTGNRAIYTGFAGAGNILPATLPLLAGLIIKISGFTAFFVIYAVLVFLSLFFIVRMDCRR